MKILFTIYSLSAGTGGGAQRLLSFMANYWSKQKNNITILTLKNNSVKYEFSLDSEINKIFLGIAKNSQNIFYGLINNIKRINIIRREIKQYKPEIIISFLTKTNILILLATIRYKIPIIVFELSDPQKDPDQKMWRLLRRFIYHIADWIVVQNQHALDYFLPAFRNKISIIHNPVILENYDLDLDNKNKHLITAMGSLEKVKGFDILLQSFALLNKDHPGISLTIMGEGSLREELVKMREDLGLNDKVQFLGWVDNPCEILKDASIFVLSSRYEGFPLSILEAMACGLPVISTDCPGGPGEIIRDGIDGILVPNEDIYALYQAMNKLIINTNLSYSMAQRALEVKSRFNIEKIMPIWDDLITKIVKQYK